MLSAVLILASSVRLAAAATAQGFAPASTGPLVQTVNYTSFSNSTLKDRPTCKGKAFNRIIQVWLENTDFATAASTEAFETLAKQGITLTNYNSVTHPSEPNYVSAIGGDFFGMHDDHMYHIPSNISTVVDLLEDKGVTWATYQESMPADEFYGFSYSAKNYIIPGSADYPFYVRKHNPLVIYDAISQDPKRVKRIRTFNDFANDAVNGTLPQWIFVTPNMVDDAHDTTIDFAASFLEYWLLPLLADPRVNDGETLIMVTFDESETFTEQNRVFAVLVGGAVPAKLHGTTDDTLYTHYSTLSTVQANWGLKSLGRGDTIPGLNNVFAWVAAKTGFRNVVLPPNEVPQFNLTGVAPGALTSDLFQPFAAPNLKARGAGGGPVLTRPGLNIHLTVASLPPPVSLTALNKTSPWQMSPRTTSGKAIIPCADALCA
ncbi:phosphoesterase family-domain-containing protein [Mycena albidolilacea]|uniref:Phosphoesterase family-domain-containing protein n=1 Tax=Mycena albidolilacea TaxID=1033008 RepID=A0AAD7EC23_9AGAR|nr:phosphoesterase family-domain-containing protein [Mycena albidolilacea]